MRRRAFALALAAAAVAGCSSFLGVEEDSPAPPAPTADATADADGTVPADAPVLTDAGTEKDADQPETYVPPYVPSTCSVVPELGPTPTTIKAPTGARADTYVAYEVHGNTPYADVVFRVCLANGVLRMDHFNGPITGAMPPYVWNYAHNNGLPAGWAQAQFFGKDGASNPLKPRAIANFFVAP